MTGEIFLVDDNSGNLSLLAGILRDAGFRVRAANTGKRALAMIQAQPPELVMLDITMPEMDGYEVCRALKADEATRHIPVIFLSALDEPLDKVKAFRAGGVDYVTKPYQAEEVVVRVENQLKIWRLQHETEEKNSELRRAYEQIQLAQEQIIRLSQPSTHRLEDTEAWAGTMAGEVARSIGVREIGVWLIEENQVLPLAPGSTSAPVINRSHSPASALELKAPEGSEVMPVIGMTSEPCGALVINGLSSPLDEPQKRLVTGLAHHLGTALELRLLRRQLSQSAAARAATKRGLHERGIETLLLCPRCGRCTSDSGKPGSVLATCPQDGASLEESRVLPFRVQGRYRFERLLGEGGMGTVFAAYDEMLDREVALKIIKPQYLGDPAMRFRLQREAKMVARIQHPAVTALFDTGEFEDGSAFLVMELLKGRVLSGLLEQFGAGTPRQVAKMLRQTGAALGAAHRVGVIHRDVKPDNIFLVGETASAGFQAKLLDFGLALSVRFEARVTHTGIPLGTPSYMSPEQIQCGKVDERSDIYSLACVAWEALIGHRLVRGKQIGEIIMNVLYEHAQPVSSLLPWVPREVDLLFATALAKSQEARPKDVEAWTGSLAAVLEGRDAEADEGWPSIGWADNQPTVADSTDIPTYPGEPSKKRPS